MKLLRALLARLYPHSLKMQMSLFVTVLFVMTTGLVGVMLVYSIQLKMRDTLVTQQYTLVESVADKLEQEIEIRRDALRHATLSVENGATSDGDQARHFLTGQLVLQTLFDRLHMFNAETLPIATYPQDPDRPGTETANYAFAESTLLTGYRLVSTPYQSIWREEHLVFMTEPVINSEGVVTGVLVGTLDLSSPNVLGTLQEAKIGKRGQFRLIAQNRVNILHSNPDRIGEVFPAAGRDPLLDRALQGWEGSEESVDAEGVAHLRSFKRLHNIDWLLEASLPTDEVFAPLSDARSEVAWWTLFFGLITAPLVWLATQRLIAPIGTLRDTIRAYRDNPGESFEASIVQRNEIGELAQEFNTMMLARSHAEQYAKHLAHYDVHTGLPNRVMAEDRLGHAIAQCRRNGLRLGVMFVDLDHFKHINDSLGHQAGDYVLMNVAARLMQCVRDSDTVARLGGDEFLIVLSDVEGPAACAMVAEKILESLSSAIAIGSYDFRVGASIGIAMYPDDGESVNSLLRSADAAMYHAKSLGRSNYQFFTASMNAAAQERVSMEQRLRSAIENKELEVHFQTQVDLAQRRIVGVEALARWNSPQGPVSPAQFIPVAEDTGLIIPIGEWILRESCRQLVAWRRAGFHHFSMSVNVSARQFQRPDFTATVKQILDESNLEPSALTLELTESVIMDSEQKSISTLEALAAMGVQLSLDDFGTGYSSLSYLKRFPLHKLKIDRSFIRDIHSDPDDAAIVRAILTMAGALDLEVVAEGVETLEQVEFLQALGCYAAQGYYFNRPLPAMQLDSLFADVCGLAIKEKAVA